MQCQIFDYKSESDIDHLIGQLHGRDNIQHVGGLPHLFFIQQIEMGQTGPADQYVNAVVFQFLQGQLETYMARGERKREA